MSILDKAKALINGDRQEDYGDPRENIRVIADMWSLYLGREITPHDVCVCMTLLKIARQGHKKKEDNLVDGAAYLELASMM